MADGKTHQRFAIAGTVAVAALTLPHGELTYTAGALMAVVVDPDLDLYQVKTQSESTMEKLLPEPLFRVWFAWTTAYGTLFPHRSFWTHTPGIGTALRLGWMLGPFVLLGVPVAWFWGWWVLKVLTGATVIDGIHLALDKVGIKSNSKKGGLTMFKEVLAIGTLLALVWLARGYIENGQYGTDSYESQPQCQPLYSHDMTRIVAEVCR